MQTHFIRRLSKLRFSSKCYVTTYWMVFALHNNTYFQFITKLLSMCFIFFLVCSQRSFHTFASYYDQNGFVSKLKTFSNIQLLTATTIVQYNQFFSPFFHFLNHKINDFYAKTDIPFIIAPLRYSHIHVHRKCVELYGYDLFVFSSFWVAWIVNFHVRALCIPFFHRLTVRQRAKKNVTKQFGKWRVRRSSYG